MTTTTAEAPETTDTTTAPAVDDAGTDTPPVKAKRRSTRRPSTRSRSTRSTADKPDAKPRARSTSTRRPAIGPRMAQLYASAGIGACVVPHPVAQAVGMQLVANSAACGDAWEKLAKEDARVAAALDRLLTASAYGSLIAAHAPIVLAALIVAGKIPAGLGELLGVTVTTMPTPADPGAAPAAPGHLVDVLARDGQNAGGRP